MENIGLAAKNRLKSMGIQMKLNSQRPINAASTVARPKISVATAFNQDSDDEPEEMPPEAKMRMRNIGRDTPTSSGPNSFGKTKHGFSDAKKVFEKNLREAMENGLQKKHTRGASSEKTVLTDTNLKESGYIAELVNDTQ
ncbi:PEST proteolytic signal-containing nuclear protein-like isoform X2 [Atheta coriaria]